MAGNGRQGAPEPAPRRGATRLSRVVAPALGLLLCACAAHPQSTLAPRGPVAQMELGLMGYSLLIMAGVFLAVVIPLGIVLVRCRDRGVGRPLPKQVEGHHGLEILWTAIPVLLLVFLAVPTVHDSFLLAAPAPASALQITVIGHQWWWEFDYPGLGIVTADEMHMPTGQRVELTLKSADVIHSFWVPRLGGKEETIPGQPNHMWLQANTAGTYPGQCAEFCGLSHSLMRFFVVAQSPAAFRAWAHGLQHPVVTPQSALAKQGLAVFNQFGCGRCHTIDGTPAQGKVGPNLTGLGNRAVVVAGALQNNARDLRQWIHDPGAIIPGTVMPPFSTLSAAQMKALTTYLEGLK